MEWDRRLPAFLRPDNSQNHGVSGPGPYRHGHTEPCHNAGPDRGHPDRTEKAFLDAITEDARTLEKLGAANIAIPCNTSHYFLEDIQAATSVPIINMVEESVRYVLENHPDVKKIGIMGTDGTIQTEPTTGPARKRE